ncbi:MAG: hypothetical protein NXI18_12990 [Alphaproteobacteria bacterium]|nr:hypothetical protein [Alphaproteobacteria bacterium]
MSDLTAEHFAKYAGQTFTLFAFGGTDDNGNEYPYIEIEMTLDAVETMKPICYAAAANREQAAEDRDNPSREPTPFEAGAPVPDLRTPFRLIFRAPDRTPLADGAYKVSHPGLGTIDSLYLSRAGIAVDHASTSREEGAEARVPMKKIDHESCVLSAIFA